MIIVSFLIQVCFSISSFKVSLQVLNRFNGSPRPVNSPFICFNYYG